MITETCRLGWPQEITVPSSKQTPWFDSPQSGRHVGGLLLSTRKIWNALALHLFHLKVLFLVHLKYPVLYLLFTDNPVVSGLTTLRQRMWVSDHKAVLFQYGLPQLPCINNDSISASKFSELFTSAFHPNLTEGSYSPLLVTVVSLSWIRLPLLLKYSDISGSNIWS